MEGEELAFAESEMACWMQLGISEEVSREELWLSMPGFVVRQPLKSRLVWSCGLLNKRLDTIHFKCTSARSIAECLQKDQFVVCLDVSKAYQTIQISPRQRKFFGMVINGRFFRLRRMPFGLNTAPRVWCRLMKIACDAIQRHLPPEVSLRFYFDDLFITAPTSELAEEAARRASMILSDLGMPVNASKTTAASTSFTFLGLVWCTRTMTVSALPSRLSKLRKDARRLVAREVATPRKLASILGVMEFVARHAPQLRFRRAPLLRELHRLLRHPARWDAPLSKLSPSVLKSLLWWTQLQPDQTQRPLRTRRAEVVLQSDGSPHGLGAKIWGPAINEEIEISRPLNSREREDSQNQHELEALELAVRMLVRLPAWPCPLHILVDSRTAMSVLRRGYSKFRHLSEIGERIAAMLQPSPSLRVQYLPTGLMGRVDELSRLPRHYDWHLDPGILRLLCQELRFSVRIDLFASALSAQVARYCSEIPDGVSRGSAFDLGVSWANGLAFPPPLLIGQVLNHWSSAPRHLRRPLLLVTPDWTSTWWHRRLSLTNVRSRQVPSSSVYKAEQLTLPPERRSASAWKWRWRVWVLDASTSL